MATNPYLEMSKEPKVKEGAGVDWPAVGKKIASAFEAKGTKAPMSLTGVAPGVLPIQPFPTETVTPTAPYTGHIPGGPLDIPKITPAATKTDAPAAVAAPEKKSAALPANARMTMGGPGSPLRDRFAPIERAKAGAAVPTGTPTGGMVTPYNDTLNADISRQTGGKGFQAIPKEMGPNAGGGNVSVMSFGGTPEEQAQQAKEVDARKAAALPAMESYSKALDQKNYEEGIHGADMARQIKMFQDKYGVDLRGKEFQLKREELAQRAPLVAAETEKFHSQAKSYENKFAEAGLKDMVIQGYNSEIASQTRLLSGEMDTDRRDEIEKTIENLHAARDQRMEKLEAKKAGGGGIPKTLDEFKQIAKAQGSKMTDKQLEDAFNDPNAAWKKKG